MALKKRRPRVSSRNLELIRGIDKYSRSKMYHKRGLWAIKVKHDGVFLKHDPKPVEKASKYYPTDDVKKPSANNRMHKPTKAQGKHYSWDCFDSFGGRFMGKLRIPIQIV